VERPALAPDARSPVRGTSPGTLTSRPAVAEDLQTALVEDVAQAVSNQGQFAGVLALESLGGGATKLCVPAPRVYIA
jgi:hypothetical protein